MDGKTLTVHDLEALLREVWAKPRTPPTITVRPDGFYADDEPTSDDIALVEGDVVRWNFTATTLFGDTLAPFGGKRPYLLGVVRNADPASCMEGCVGVVMSTGAGGQFARGLLRRHE